MICKYCKKEIDGKGYMADGERYHLKCVRKLRKEIDRQKYQMGIELGKSNKIKINS